MIDTGTISRNVGYYFGLEDATDRLWKVLLETSESGDVGYIWHKFNDLHNELVEALARENEPINA